MRRSVHLQGTWLHAKQDEERLRDNRIKIGVDQDQQAPHCCKHFTTCQI